MPWSFNNLFIYHLQLTLYYIRYFNLKITEISLIYYLYQVGIKAEICQQSSKLYCMSQL